MLDAVLAERFAAKCSLVPEGSLACVVWLGAMAPPDGRPLLWVPSLGRATQAARIAWELATGIGVPDHLEVLHVCDHSWCVRGDHLSVGTHGANMAQMAARARSAVGRSVSRLPETERVDAAYSTALAVRDRHRRLAARRCEQPFLF
jgi:hypothetical protein